MVLVMQDAEPLILVSDLTLLGELRIALCMCLVQFQRRKFLVLCKTLHSGLLEGIISEFEEAARKKGYPPLLGK